MPITDETQFETLLSEREVQLYFESEAKFFEFVRLFDYNETSDRAVAIVGPAYLDALLAEILTNFFVDDEKETQKLLQPEGPLGAFGARVTLSYSLGLIGKIVKADLRLIAKIRNRFAHDLRADFADPQIGSWCQGLRWHEQLFPHTPAEATNRDLFQVGIHQVVSHLRGLVGLSRIRRCKEFQPGSG